MSVLPVSAFHGDIEAGTIAAYPIADANVHRILALAQQADRTLPAAVEEVSQIVASEMNALLDIGVFSVPSAKPAVETMRDTRRATRKTTSSRKNKPL